MLQARNLRLQEVNWGLASREDATKQQRRSSQAGESEGEDALTLHHTALWPGEDAALPNST